MTDKNDTDKLFSSLEEMYDTCMEAVPDKSSEYSDFIQQFSYDSDRYSEEVHIESGGMKSISKVYDQQIGRHLALAKLIDDENELLYMSFIREAQLTALLEHPNIITVHDIGFYDNNKPFFTMELKTGDNLKDILKERLKDKASHSIQKLIVVFQKVCDAVEYSHSRNVLHLDIKPENIQVGKYGEVALCDWGLATIKGKIQDAVSPLDPINPDILNEVTLNSKIKGTPGFMAPEQFNDSANVDTRTDIYALGALLYAILTGHKPVNGTLEKIREKTETGDIIPPIERSKDVPSGLNAIVLKAMNLNPDNRYQAVDEMTNDINKYLEGFSPLAEKSGPFNELNLFYQRHKKLCLFTLIFSLIFFITVSIFIINLNKTKNNALAMKKQADINLEKYLKEKDFIDPILNDDPTPFIDREKMRLFSQMAKDPEVVINEVHEAFERMAKSNKSHIVLYEVKGEVQDDFCNKSLT